MIESGRLQRFEPAVEDLLVPLSFHVCGLPLIFEYKNKVTTVGGGGYEGVGADEEFAAAAAVLKDLFSASLM